MEKIEEITLQPKEAQTHTGEDGDSVDLELDTEDGEDEIGSSECDSFEGARAKPSRWRGNEGDEIIGRPNVTARGLG